MTIVKNAVRAKITGILSRYSEKSVGNVYFHLYESIEDEGISSTLSFLHQEINSLLVSMNKRSKTGTRYYLSGWSSELIQLIQDAGSIKKSLKLLGYTLSIDHDYLEHLLYVKTFLKESGGSTIPDDYECIEIKDIEPIFKLSEKNKIVETQNIEKITQESAREQIQKCKDKISNGDYPGAITNSRSLVESVIKDIYEKITGSDMESKGSLPKDWQELSNLLNLHPEKYSNKNIQQILTGLNAIINGISSMRNKLSDGHGHSKDQKVQKHHAVLAVNSALTITDFLFETYEYQVKIKKINPQQKD